jgi:hypothetical protein
MEQLQAFVQEQWLLIAVVVVAFILVVKLVKTAIKWAIILVILVALVVYGANYKDTLTSIKDAVMENAGAAITETIKDQAANAIRDEAKEAKFTSNADGSFTIKSKTVQIDGSTGSDTVKVTIAGQSFNMKAVDAVKTFIDTAKNNQ